MNTRELSSTAENPAVPGRSSPGPARQWMAPPGVQETALPGANRRPRSEFSALGSEPLIGLQEPWRTCPDS